MNKWQPISKMSNFQYGAILGSLVTNIVWVYLWSLQ
jgi:hypothetical protein